MDSERAIIRTKRRWKAGILVLGALAGLSTGALASVPDGAGVVHTCFSKATGTWRPIDYPTEQCKRGETQLDLNQRGVPGDVGPQGPTGPQGPPGPGVESLTAFDGTPCTVGEGQNGTVRLEWRPDADGARHYDGAFICELDERPAPPPDPYPPGEVAPVPGQTRPCDDGDPRTVNDQAVVGSNGAWGPCGGTPDPTWDGRDDDGDGLTNGDELSRGSDPQDPHDPHDPKSLG